MLETKTPSPELALWLVPGPEDRLRLGATIRELSALFSGSGPAPPIFPPHVTLFGGVSAPRGQVLASLAALARETPPVTCRAGGFGHSPSFFQCFFLTFPDEVILDLREALGPEVGKSPTAAAQPHLSLLYAELGAVDRAKLIHAVRLPPAITFDALEVVAPGDGVAGWRDVEGWETVARFALTGAPV